MTAEKPIEITNTDLLEFSTHSFILKIWLEETAEETQSPTWRGHITHVPSGTRQYVSKFNSIIAFIMPYLRAMGVRFGTLWQVRDWLDRQVDKDTRE
ncbi:MAG: hypothetical protein GTO18_19615 [Anaerolineales bacterium]|nr:hypothetical protein [Anaerolineales bacterium]